MHALEMQKTDMHLPSPRNLFNDLLIALSLLTRLPVPQADWSNARRPPARAAWAYPLVGLVVGCLAAAIGLVAEALHVGPMIVAALMLAVLSITTGAMHEDGLADCTDGFWGGWEKARRLEIMQDSAIGAYGVLALILTFALKWGSVSALLASTGTTPWIILIPAIMSRAAIVVVMQLLPNAKGDGLSAKTGKPGKPAMFGAIGLSVGVAVLAPTNFFVLICVMGLSAFVVGLVAARKIGGQTGDVLGATQVVTEVALLITLSAAIA